MSNELQGQPIIPKEGNKFIINENASANSRYPEKDIKAKFPLEVMKAIRKGSLDLSETDKSVVKDIAETNWAQETLQMSDPAHRQFASLAIALGAPACCGFGNFYGIVGHPCWESVRYINLSKGRQENQVGSITTTKENIQKLFDWGRLPEKMDQESIVRLINEFNLIGPFGFRGPAASHIPNHLVSEEDDNRTTQIISPGYECPSNEILAKAIDQIEEDYLFVTSANVSHHAKGLKEEAAHYKIHGIQEEFGEKPGYFMVAHDHEDEVQIRYPNHLPMSTSILSFHRKVYNENGKLSLVLERYGSLT